MPAADPAFKLNFNVPVAADRVIVNGAAVVIVVLAPVTPVPSTTVHVPAETVIVVVGAVPDVPARVKVMVVAVEVAAYPTGTETAVGVSDADAMLKAATGVMAAEAVEVAPWPMALTAATSK